MCLHIQSGRLPMIVMTVIFPTIVTAVQAARVQLLDNNPEKSLGSTVLEKTGTTGVRQNAKGPQTLFFRGLRAVSLVKRRGQDSNGFP